MTYNGFLTKMMGMTDSVPEKLSPHHSKRSITSWCLYDWANSAFSTVIITFVFSVFFTRGIVGDETYGAVLWSYAIGLSGLFIALLAPLMGAVADHSGNRKTWIFCLSWLCIVATSLLWFAQPHSSSANILFVLTLVILANIGFELAQVFYNAMLAHIAPSHLMGRISGWGWAAGYIGGLCALALALFGLVGFGDVEPFLPISGADSANLRATGPMTALWFLIFMLPLLWFTRDVEHAPLPFIRAFKTGARQIWQMLRDIKSHKNIALFLVASAIYRDGLVTLFAIGGVYAAGQYGMDFAEILIFAIGLNVFSGLGAFVFGWLDDYLGSKPTIMISLMGLIAFGVSVLFVHDQSMFTALAFGMGFFIGPVQAASRTLAGRLAPHGMITQTYGLYAFTGKSIAFMGPVVYGLATQAFGTQQAGMMSIVMFWVVGLLLLAGVREGADD